jgi:benzoyl-CoA-dihydrodiol lyase
MYDPTDFSFSTNPSQYNHISLHVAHDEAVVLLQINPDLSLRGDTPLKLNSYDLGVDIELNDALMRLRFEHPQVSVLTITSAHPQVFCSGANIYMLKKSSHGFKVNFCKYTNETRLYLEEASRFSGLKTIAALNGTSAGGGYELALACDKIILLDDKAANVSLPEVPLLGVLPGTGGLTRLVDKRNIRRDIADMFCTVAEGFKGEKAKNLGLVDQIYTKSQWTASLQQEVAQLKSPTKKHDKKITLEDISPKNISAQEINYEYIKVQLSSDRTAKITIAGPHASEPTQHEAMLERGSNLWLLRAFRELDDAILRLRFFHQEIGLWQLHAVGDPQLILEAEQPLYNALHPDAHWFLRELLLNISRVLKRLETSARSLTCLLSGPTAFVGALAELLWIADRVYAEQDNKSAITLTPINQGLLCGWNNMPRLYARFLGHEAQLARVHALCTGKSLSLEQAYELGLITTLLDNIDYLDEVRLFIEERTALSPDALSAMEANLRFNGPETLATKIFGRLSAWQNWVFIRDNATGPQGALTSYGAESRPVFDFKRC